MEYIKFRRAHYSKDGFIKYTFWGKIDHKGQFSQDVFSSPAQISSCIKTIDEQYIGRKDREGVEIYEGSIINVYNWDIDNQDFLFAAKVIWNEVTCGWMWESRLGESCTEDYLIEEYDRWLNVEEVGNIHENEDLLV